MLLLLKGNNIFLNYSARQRHNDKNIHTQRAGARERDQIVVGFVGCCWLLLVSFSISLDLFTNDVSSNLNRFSYNTDLNHENRYEMHESWLRLCAPFCHCTWQATHTQKTSYFFISNYILFNVCLFFLLWVCMHCIQHICSIVHIVFNK